MKKANANIYQWVTVFTAVFALASTAVPLAGPQGDGDRGTAAEIVSIGPGRVRFDVGPTGRWLALSQSRAEGKGLFAGGGFLVMALAPDGTVEELANTAGGDARLRPVASTAGQKRVYEGIPGGRRYPLDQRDDDGDGRVDEDRLDGVDNDGDNRIDEDFAAAGDQMVTLSFETLDETGRPLLLFYQENYAWTLPNIDGMVAIKLCVENVSGRKLEGVHIGAVFRAAVSSETVVSMQNPGATPPFERGDRMASKAIVLTESGHPGMAALFFAEPDAEETAWLTGLSAGEGPLADRMAAALGAQRGAGTERAGTGPSQHTAPATPEPPAAAGARNQTAYAISPDLGELAPGQEAVVYAALLVVPEVNRLDSAVESAYRTVVGDGIHRMIPPPVALKRRAVWGTYKIEYDREEQTPVGLTITLENARGQDIGAGDLSYVSGIDMSQMTATSRFNGDLELAVTGQLYGEIAETGKRIELHGRLKNGEFVELLLNPVDRGRASELVDGMSESRYWSRPGRLDEDLLTGSPNPFRESTTIYYEVPTSISDEDGSVLNFVNPVRTTLKVYNVAGRLVSMLVDTILSPGQYTTSWEATDDNGSSVASGVYYVKLQIGNKHVTKRLIQLK
jgi:hypothetical protein